MPYAPGVQPRGSDYLFEGISRAGQSIGEGIAAMRQRARQADAFRRMAVDGLGMDPDQVDKMNFAQLQGTLAGAALKQSNMGQQLMQRLTEAQGVNARLQNEITQRRQAAMQAFGQKVGNYFNGGGPAGGPSGGPVATPGPGGAEAGPGMMNALMPAGSPDAGTGGGPPPLDPQTLLRFGAESGMAPQDMMEMMNSSRAASQAHRYEAQGNYFDSRAAASGGDQPIVDQSLPGGYVGFRMPGTGQMDVRPDLTKTGSAVDVQDEGGSPLGSVVNVGGKNIFRPTKPAVTNKLLNAVDSNGKAIDGLYINPNNGQHVDMRDQTQKSFGGAAAPATGGAAASGTVRVIDPQGRLGTLPAAQLQQALSEGYKQAPAQ